MERNGPLNVVKHINISNFKHKSLKQLGLWDLYTVVKQNKKNINVTKGRFNF